jgi:hypothetical protein
MSYIRSGSNPEKLYIVGTGEHIEIMERCKDVWHIPSNIFTGLLKKFDRTFAEFPCEFKGAKVDEVWVGKNNNEETPDDEYEPSPDNLLECKVKLTYKEHSLYMWYVTWAYLVNGEMDRVRRFTPHKVYVKWDPLYEKVLCVHEKPNKSCRSCRNANKVKDGYRNTYQTEEKGFTIQTENKLSKQ